MKNHMKRTGFTLPEFLIALICVGILLALLMPRERYSREAARRSMCMNNIRDLALAAISYESTHQEFPMGVGIKDQGGVLQANPVSGFVALLPFIDQDKFYDEISNPMVVRGTEHPAFEASLADSDYPPWAKENSIFICPSAASDTSKFGRTSYAFSVGDVARNISQQESLRGAFGYFKALDTTDVKDGCSNTIGIVEIGGSTIDNVTSGCLASGKASWLDNPKQVFSAQDKWHYTSGVKLIDRGSHWADGRAGVGLANMILPINSPSFQVQGSPTADGVYSVGSKHSGGAHVANLDGSTHYVSEDIDTGDGAATLTFEQMAAGVPSPHGVWGAAGTIASEEETYQQDW